MRSETIRVKKPAWVRIVNPDPIRILDMTWSYGSIVLIRPGGVFRTLCAGGRRTLAMYHPPCAPSDTFEAPPDAIVLHTLGDLRLLAEGAISDEEPFDDPIPRRAPSAPARIVRVGDRARVPKSRRVRASPPEALREVVAGSPYRPGRVVMPAHDQAEWRTLRPGGEMTVFACDDKELSALLMVRYRAEPGYRGEQCPTGAWFLIPEEEFLAMGKEYRHRRELEDLECAVVISMLRSL